MSLSTHRRAVGAAAAAVVGLAVTAATGAPAATSASAATAVNPSGASIPPAAPGYQLVGADDFDGTTIDSNKWSVYNGSGNQHGPRCRQNTTVSGGMLILRETKVNGVWCGAGVSGARLSVQKYGTYLVRSRLDKGYGVRAVALLWPTTGWPPEVDFFETAATDANRTSTMLTNHYSPSNLMQHAKVTADFTQWHTIGVTWTPSTLTFTLDGLPTAVMTRNVPATTMWPGLQTGIGNATHAPNETTPPAVDYDIDWVAVYAPTS